MDRWYAIENESEVASPALLLYPDRIRANIQRMIEWGGEDGASRIRPHVKTHKMPAIIKMKLDAGITKFKVSTIAEAEMTASAGARDILIAYQPVGPNQRRVIELSLAFPSCRFAVIVDSVTVAEQLAAAARVRDVVLDTFVDLNLGMNRTGIEPGDGAMELYRKVASLTGLQTAGLHAYDGHLRHTDASVLRDLVESAFRPVWSLKRR
ncbi:MAG: alanine racemase, partial [Planctomycetota bacterium]